MQERTSTMTGDAYKPEERAPEQAPGKGSLFGWVAGIFRNKPPGEFITLPETAENLQSSARIPSSVEQFKLTLGRAALEFHLDLPVTRREAGSNQGWVVFRAPSNREGVPEFVRIESGEVVVFGRSAELQTWLFGFDQSVADRHVKVSNNKGNLIIEVLDPDRTTKISALHSAISLREQRRANLERLPEVLGRPLIPFSEAEALDAINEINTILSVEAYREPNDDGDPGGIIMFPDDMTVVVLGDIHARTDNLLRVITEGGFLSALESGKVCLVLLGDLMHSERADELEDMESSVLVLDFFCMLKRRFPENIFYLHGNHESFGAEVSKGGVPQALLLRKHLKKQRGAAYLKAVQEMFDRLAFIVQGNNFAGCHGAPVRSKVSRDALVNIHRYPGLQSEIVWNRPRGPNRPTGYGKGSVKRFRQTLSLPKGATLVVGHTPQSETETLWMDINGITGNHILYSAHTDRMAVMVMRDGHATPLQYIPERALDFLKRDRTPGKTPEAEVAEKAGDGSD